MYEHVCIGIVRCHYTGAICRYTIIGSWHLLRLHDYPCEIDIEVSLLTALALLVFLLELATDSTGHETSSVDIGQEARWVGLNLAQAEANASILSIGAIQACAEGSFEAAERCALPVIPGRTVDERRLAGQYNHRA